MSSESETKHIATVVSITPNTIQLKVDSATAKNCGGCAIASMCNITSTQNISVSNSIPNLAAGSRVIIAPAPVSEWNAIIFAFGYPLLAIILAVGIMSFIGIPQLWAALGALVVLALYFCALYAFRRGVAKKVEWRIIDRI